MPIERRGATYMTVTELAEKLGVHRNTVIYWIDQEQLDAVRAGLAKKSPWMIPMDVAEETIAKFQKENGQ